MLDLRLPMGLMFTLVGALLVIYGVLPLGSESSLGINVNLYWGLVLVVFGLIMLGLAHLAAAAEKDKS
jgi:hypothetical protein